MLVGDRIPFFAAIGADQRLLAPDVIAGRPAIIVVARDAAQPAVASLLTCLADQRAALDGHEAALVAVLDAASGPDAWRSGPAAARGIATHLALPDTLAALGVSPDRGARLLVLDRGTRLVLIEDAAAGPPALLAARAVAACAALPRETPRACTMPAPILTVPGLLDRGLCARLIAAFESGPSFESGVSGAGDPTASPADPRLDPAKKRRRDLLLEPDTALHDEVQALLARRCFPDIARSFQHRVGTLDRILIARYTAGAGYFRRHRDNLHDAVASRQFALSVNLNAGEYEGGDLLFPEFNDHPHRAGTGTGIVFSASLLHEVTEVTEGARYALLTFFRN